MANKDFFTSSLTPQFIKAPFSYFKPARLAVFLENILAKKLISVAPFSKVILGLSGGLDSVLAYLITINTYQKLSLPLNELFAYYLPTSNNTLESYNIFIRLTTYFKTNAQVISFEEEYQNLKEKLSLNDSISIQNMQARLRQNILLTLANKEKGIVLGTSDLSEIALGYMTYGGDNVSMYSLLRGIPKSVIKVLVAYYGQKYPQINELLTTVINRPISAELLPNQSSEKELGLYEVNDFILYYLLKEKVAPSKLLAPLKNFFSLADNDAKNYLNRFIDRFNCNHFKLVILAPGPNPFHIKFPKMILKDITND